MGGGLCRFVTFCLISPVSWYGRQMLPNVAGAFDQWADGVVSRGRILYSCLDSASMAGGGITKQRVAIVDGLINCPLVSGVEICDCLCIGQLID